MAQVLQAFRDAVSPLGLESVNLAYASADAWHALQDPTASHGARIFAGIKAAESAVEAVLSKVRLPANWQGPVEIGEALVGLVFQCHDVLCAGPLTDGADLVKVARSANSPR